jgi:hypothetical protein
MAKMGRPPLVKDGVVIKGLTLSGGMMRRVMAHARTMRKKRSDPPDRNSALRDLIERGLNAAENEFEG